MGLDQQNVDLFLATAPVFVASLPPAPDRENVPVDAAALALDNSIVGLRFEIGRLLETFSLKRAAIKLSEGDYQKAKDALENILCTMDNLVDDSISGHQQNPGFSALESLKHRISKLNPALSLDGLPNYPDEVRKYISYAKPGKEAAQHRVLAQIVGQFNEDMDRLFSCRSDTIESEATEIFYRDRNNEADDSKVEEINRKEINAAKKLCSAAKTIARIMTSSDCQKPHSAYINLTGFPEAKIFTIMTVCRAGNKWRAVQWSSTNSHDVSTTTNQTLRAVICEEIRRPYRSYPILHIGFCADGSWRTQKIRQDVSASHKNPPETKLADVIFPESAKENLIRLEKSDLLRLAARLGESLLCLLGSPFLQDAWNSETMRFSHGDIFVPGHFHKDIDRDPKTAADNKSFVLRLGVLLWELFFQQQINITEEDKEEDDDDMSLFNALYREEQSWRHKFVDTACLDIIVNCLDVFCEDVEDEENEEKLRASIHGKIFRPLREYLMLASSSHAPSNDTPTVSRPQSLPNSSNLADNSATFKKMRTSSYIPDPIERFQNTFTLRGSGDMYSAPLGNLNIGKGNGYNFPGSNFNGSVAFYVFPPSNPPPSQENK